MAWAISVLYSESCSIASCIGSTAGTRWGFFGCSWVRSFWRQRCFSSFRRARWVYCSSAWPGWAPRPLVQGFCGRLNKSWCEDHCAWAFVHNAGAPISRTIPKTRMIGAADIAMLPMHDRESHRVLKPLTSKNHCRREQLLGDASNSLRSAARKRRLVETAGTQWVVVCSARCRRGAST